MITLFFLFNLGDNEPSLDHLHTSRRRGQHDLISSEKSDEAEGQTER